ncbi:MAG: type B DNA-directed DNA polymerase, partial [Thermoprotei archaeon]
MDNLVEGREYVLLSVRFDGSLGRAVLTLLDPVEQKIVTIPGDEDHKPYLLTDLSEKEVLNIAAIRGHKSFVGVVSVYKRDVLRDRDVKLTKVMAKDPLSIGRGPRSFREIIKSIGGHVWEGDIKYHNCYIYDKLLIPGYYYVYENGRLKRKKWVDKSGVREKIFSLVNPEFEEAKVILDELIPLFQTPSPQIKMLALDIEVSSLQEDVIPNVRETEEPIIAVALASNDGMKKVLIFDMWGKGEVESEEYEVEIFKDERELIKRVCEEIRKYPFVLTFNGDNFDIPYLKHRAQKLGLIEESKMFRLAEDMATIECSVHIDLYKFFHNKSIQTYVFGGKYRETTLNGVAKAILNMEKVSIEKSISELSNKELADYCFRDSELTLKLATFNNYLLIKLMFLFMRISKLTCYDVTRFGISTWIKNFLYYEFRRRNFLIPTKEEIRKLKGEAVSEAKIKGKKYLGAIVLNPKPGVHFNVAVLDFSSLYPS